MLYLIKRRMSSRRIGLKSGRRPISRARGSGNLGRLIERYRPWVLAHLASRFQFESADLQDILHSFVEQKILQDGLLSQADARRGSFRAFLRSAINNFAVSEIRRRKAQKRSSGGDLISIDLVSLSDIAAEPDAELPGSDIVWVQAVVAGALLDMRNELARVNRLDIGKFSKAASCNPCSTANPLLCYTKMVARFNYTSPSQAINVLVTGKRMFRRHLRAVIAQYSASDPDVDKELACLKWLLKK